MKQASKGNTPPVTQSVTGAAWHLPDEKNPVTGEAMRRELLMNDLFLVYSWYKFIVRRLVLFN
jgi:hypothetical protein